MIEVIVFGESGKGFHRNTLHNDAHLGGIVDLVVEKVSEGHGVVAGERLPIECELTVLFANEGEEGFAIGIDALDEVGDMPLDSVVASLDNLIQKSSKARHAQ